MKCCQCQGIENVFNAKTAAKDLRRYRSAGPADVTGILIDALKAEGIDGMTLLDIGGGVGGIQHELLVQGVVSATSVDASTAYIDAAREEARRRGLDDRVVYHRGDFVDLAPDIEPADIVTLDAVICCYHDVDSLVGLSAQRARRLYGFVYPRDTWWMRVGFAAMNLYFRAIRDPFRTFLHPTPRIDSILQDNGLTRTFRRQTRFWQVMVYRREPETQESGS